MSSPHGSRAGEAFDVVAAQGVVAIVRTGSAAAAAEAATTILDAGLDAVEVSLTTPGALDVVRDLAAAGRGVIGAGTVRTLDDARAAHAAGARFLVSPVLDVDVVRYAVEHDLAAFPGCVTPTEMETARRAGAHAVKIFPAHLWSPAALRGLLEAMPDLPCVPTGGVGPADAAEWIAAGAVALGIGGALTRADDPAAAVAQLLGEIADARASRG